MISPTACGALFSARTTRPCSPRRTSWNPGGTLVEDWWNSRGALPQGRPGPPGPPRTTPEPVWAETPKLSAVGENTHKRNTPHNICPDREDSSPTLFVSCFIGPKGKLEGNQPCPKSCAKSHENSRLVPAVSGMAHVQAEAPEQGVGGARGATGSARRGKGSEGWERRGRVICQTKLGGSQPSP